MARDHYDVLGISVSEGTRGVRSAHRDLARHFHPERAGRGGTRRYQRTQQAFGVLSDRTARETYDRTPPTAQPSGETRPRLSLRRDFQHGDPPLDEVLDTIRRDFTGDLRKSGRVDTLALCVHAPDASLELGVPVYHPCPTCHGTGSVMAKSCSGCDGSGAVETEENVPTDARNRISLRHIGIHGLEVHLVRVS